MQFVFADFRLDTQTVELLRAGQRVSVQPKVYRLLMHLVKNRHRSVGNEELLTVIWPDEHVSLASITSAVRNLRRVLGDLGASQAAIRTVRGHGYQFVLPVTEVSEPPNASVAAQRGEPRAMPADTFEAAFVGRAGVLSALDHALSSLHAGPVRHLLLTGEPGIGKTRTLHELAARARRAGARVWFSRCLEGDGAPPFWPVVQLVREAVGELGAEALGPLMGGGAVDIAQAVPELHAWLPHLPEPKLPLPGAARFRFFDSFTSFVKRAAADRPLVLLFDDLHNGDEPTTHLLGFLKQHLERTRVLIVGATRPVAATDPAGALTNGVAKPSATVDVALAGFSVNEVSSYLAQRTGQEAPQPVVSQLHDQTAGNPLYLQQLVDALCTRDEAHSQPPWEQLLASSRVHGVSAAIARHLETVTAPCRALLQTASVLGRDFSLGLLLEMATPESDPTGRERVLALLSEAHASGLTCPLESHNQHRFRHALIRDVLYEQIPQQQRVHLHRGAALALERRGAGSDSARLAQLADHFIHAAPLLSVERALHYALRAAEDATQKLAYEEAAHHIDRALAVSELGEPDRSRRLRLLLAKGEALTRATFRKDTRAVLLEAAHLARELGATEGLFEAVTLLARPAELGEPDPTLVAWLREALALLPASDARRTELTALLAKALSYSDETEESVKLAQVALDSVQRDPLTKQRIETLFACHEALAGPAHLGIRLQLSDELMRIGQLRADSGVLARATITRIWTCVERGDMAAADLAIDALEALAPRVREPFFDWSVLAYRAMRAIVSGDLESARVLSDRAFSHGALIGEDFARHLQATQLTSIYFFGGRHVEGEALLRWLTARYPLLGSWRAVLAHAHALLGHAAHARKTLEELVADDLRALRREPYLLTSYAAAADLCAMVGDAELARPLYRAALPFEDHCGHAAFGMTTHGPMARHLGWLALRMGDAPRSLRHFERAVAHAERMQSPPYLSLSLGGYAAALCWVHGDMRHATGRAALSQAVRIAEASKLSGIVRSCEAIAAHLDRRAPSEV